jgi:PAS domain-containing protein
MLIDLVLPPGWISRERNTVYRREGTTLTRDYLERKNGKVYHYWGKAPGSTTRTESGRRHRVDQGYNGQGRARNSPHLAQVLDIAPASITIHDREGNFLYANQKTFDIHGYSRDEFMKMRPQDVDTPESAALIAPRMADIMKDGEGSFTVTHRT